MHPPRSPVFGLWSLVSGLFFLILLSGCGKRTAPVADAVDSRTLLLGNAAEPADLDPQLAAILSDQIIATALFEGLTLLDEKTTQPLAAAAESWTTSSDGLTWTFRLRDNLKWSNGEPLTADDFVQSWRRLLSPAFAADNAWYLFALKNAEAFNAKKLTDPAALGFRAPDPRTLVLTLERPTPYLAALVSMPAWFPVNPRALAKFDALEKRGTAWTRPGNLVSNGPFSLAEWRPNARIVVQKNPHHRDAATTQLERIVFHPIENPDVEERDYRAGQLHVTFNLPVTKIAPWRQNAPAQLRIDPTLQINFLRFNTSRPPLNDPRVRRALARTIDRATLARAVLQGSREPAFSITPPNTGGYQPPNLATITQASATEDVPDFKNFPPLELQCRNDEIMPRIAEALQAMWRKELGLNVTISQLEQKTWIQNMQSGNYTLSTSAWTADFPDPITFLGMFTENSAYNWTAWKSPDYEKLLDQAANTADRDARFALLHRAESLLLAEAPVTPLHFGAQTYLLHPSVKNWPPAPLVFRRFQIVRLEK